MTTHHIKKYSFQFVIFILISSAIACQKNIDLNIDTFDPSIAIFGVLEADSVPKLFITESEPYYTYFNRELNYQLIQNATVTITDGSNTWPLQPDSVFYLPLERRYSNYGGGGATIAKKSWAFTTNMQIKSNATYTLSVTKNNTTATAETIIIGDIGDFEATVTTELVESYGYGGDFEQEFLNVNFNSTDYGQYYRVLTKRTNKYFRCELVDGYYIPEDTIVIEDISYSSFEEISDSLDIQTSKSYFWIGNCVVYTCGGENEFLDFKELEVAIQVVDGDMVKYINQLENQEYVAYNPFLEPAPVDQKVENGIGILSSSKTSQWKKFKFLCD